MGILIQSIKVFHNRPDKQITDMNVDVREKNTVWVCFRREASNRYHLQGIFVDNNEVTGEQLAASACLDDTYFIGALPINTIMPERAFEWTTCYRPNPTPRLEDLESEPELVPVSVESTIFSSEAKQPQNG